MVVYRNGKNSLRILLTDDILVKIFLYFPWGGNLEIAVIFFLSLCRAVGLENILGSEFRLQRRLFRRTSMFCFLPSYAFLMTLSAIPSSTASDASI